MKARESWLHILTLCGSILLNAAILMLISQSSH